MKRIFLCAVLALTVGAAPPLRSPRDATAMQNAPMRRVAAAVAIEQVRLTWKYPLPMPQPSLVFDIEYRVNLKTGSWSKIGETNKPPFTYTVSSGKMGFFRVISRSTVTNSVTLAWDRSPGTTVVSYVIYRGGFSGSYTNSTTVAGASSTTAVIPNITGRTFFTATAKDSSGIESVPSNEVDYTPLSVTLYPVSSLTITKL